MRDEQVHLVVIDDEHLPAAAERITRHVQGIEVREALPTFFQQNRKPELAAPPRRAVHPDRAAHEFGEFLRNREAQPGTAVFARVRLIDLAELLEELAPAFGVDADATVLDGDAQPDAPLHRFERIRDLAGHADVTVLRELDAVAQQVRHDLAQPDGVAANHVRDVARDEVAQVQVFALRLRRKQLRDVGERAAERKVHGFQHDLAGLDLGKVENRIDDLEERHARVVHDLCELPLFGRQIRSQQQAGHADDAVHRRPNLVAHVGEEAALGLARSVRLVARDHEVPAALARLGLARGKLGRALDHHRLEQVGPLVELAPVTYDQQSDEGKGCGQRRNDQRIQ